MANVEGKVAVVTGGGAGIGRATAILLAKGGAKVVVTDIKKAEGQETANKILAEGGEVIFLAHDVASEEEWQHVLAAAKDRFGGIDVLVNNAGIYFIAPLAETTLEQWNRLFAINVSGVFLGSKHVVPYLTERGRVDHQSVLRGWPPRCRRPHLVTGPARVP